jgi:hypothetical protein
MAKDAFYFPHDSNARNDARIRAMRTVYGAEGLGWYWMIIEILREQDGYKLPVNKYTFNSLSMELGCQPQAIEKFIKDCITEFTDPNGSLLCADESYVFSNSLLRRMGIVDQKREQAKEAADIRWGNKPRLLSTGNANALLPQYVGNASKVKESKESKVKKVKDITPKNSYGEFKNVYLSEDEYQKLTVKFNSHLPEMIEQLSIGIESKGYKYKSHYATILSWARKDEKDGNNGANRQNPGKLAPGRVFTDPTKFTRPEDY